jgi:hypothetical protein
MNVWKIREIVLLIVSLHLRMLRWKESNELHGMKSQKRRDEVMGREATSDGACKPL